MTATRGPLRRCRDNPRYFEDADGRVVWLTGSHTWANFATDQGRTALDFEAYLDWLGALGHNFVRGWNWDLPRSRQGHNGGPFTFGPQAFLRTGPGPATDGLPRFDLTRWNPAFFDRLRRRARQAAERGIYVSVMLFQGYAWQFDRAPDDGMPYDGRNNVNGIDAGTAAGAATLGNPAVRAVQEAYIRCVVEAVGDLDNVLYEIANEAPPSSTAWQHHLIEVLRLAQDERGQRNPIGMTFQFEGGIEADLRAGGADWISPDSDPQTRARPPAADGAQVIVYDTDHGYDWRTLRSQTGAEHREWVWRCLCRGGGGVLFMDPHLARIAIDGETRNEPRGENPAEPYFGLEPDPFWNPLREAMGHARAFADTVGLRTMTPRPELASTGSYLADPGREYVVYAPDAAALHIRLARGSYRARWFDTATGRWSESVEVDAAPTTSTPLTSPFEGGTAHLIRT